MADPTENTIINTEMNPAISPSIDPVAREDRICGVSLGPVKFAPRLVQRRQGNKQQAGWILEWMVAPWASLEGDRALSLGF